MGSIDIPKTTKTWTIEGTTGFNDLKFKEVSIPELSDNEVLVKFHFASLNYRDLMMPKGQLNVTSFHFDAILKRGSGNELELLPPRTITAIRDDPKANNFTGLYPFPSKDGVVPGSDGAGEVIAVGKKVNRFKVGAKVVTLFNQGHIGGPPTQKGMSTGLGGSFDGTLRQYGVFNEEGLVDMPTTLPYQEAGSLSCAAVTAWNALYGLRPLLPGQTVLTQGTGGVSIFALQFAKAAGAKVIATTSSAAKGEILKKLGADHVINYKDEPEWGAKAKSLTPNEAGVDHILEVAGPTTMIQNFNAIKHDGIISIIGFLGGFAEKQPSFLEALNHGCIVRGILIGSRLQFEEMVSLVMTLGSHALI